MDRVSQRRTMMKENIYLALKILLSFGLIGFIFYKTDIDSLLVRMQSVNIYWLALMLLLPHMNIVLSSIKWQWLLNALGISVRLPQLVSLYMIGTFFSNFLPSMVGGDVVRTFQLSRDTRETASVIAATFAERFCGVTALISFFFLVLIHQDIYTLFPSISGLALLVLIGYCTIILLIFKQKDLGFLASLRRLKILGKTLEILEESHLKLIQYKDKKQTIVASYFISVLFYMIGMCTVFVAAQSLDIEIDVKVISIVIPLVLLIGLLPISLGGLGLNEGSYVFFFTMFGATEIKLPTLAAWACRADILQITGATYAARLMLRRRNSRRESGSVAVGVPSASGAIVASG
ncbi:MAG: lysylphosphatidylglycerol synthase transmembrane domain-containing protein, partial [Nitrospiria bacterium]